MTGFVYFLRCGDFVKVGFSLKPNLRLNALRTATPHGSELMALLPGTPEQEKLAHRALQSVHHVREWFRNGQEVADLIKNGIPRKAVRVSEAIPFADLPASVLANFAAIGAEETLRLHLLSLFDAYKAGTSTPHSVIGRNAARDHMIHARLMARTGSFTINTYDRLIKWFDTNWPAEAAWPIGVPRPATTEATA